MERIQLTRTLTQKQLEKLLGISSMTVYLWRKMPDPLPCRTIPTEGGRHRIFFFLSEVKEWLVSNRPRLVRKLTQGGNNVEVYDGGRARAGTNLVEGTAA